MLRGTEASMRKFGPTLVICLLGTLALAGCKKTPPDCKKVKDYFCGPNGTPEECQMAKNSAESKNGPSCAKTFMGLKEARKLKETAAAKAKQDAAFTAEKDFRAPIIAEMDKVSANRYDLGEKLLAAKGAEKKKIEAIMAEISEDPGSAQSGDAYDVAPGARLVPEFIQLGLRLNVGEAGIVETVYGYHVIQRVG